MWNKVHYIFMYSLIIILGFTTIKYFSESYQVVAEVNGKEVHKKEVQEILTNKYFDTALDSYIEEELLNLEKEKIKKPTEQQLKQYFNYYQLLNRKATDYPTHKNKVENYYYTSELIKKYTIKNNELEKFIESEGETLGSKVYTVYKLEANHDVIMKIDNEIKNGEEIQNLQKKFKVTFKQHDVFSKDNPYNVDLSNMKKGDTVHVQGQEEHSHEPEEKTNAHQGHEGHDMSGHEGHGNEKAEEEKQSTDHTLLIISTVKENYKLNLKENKKEIINVYLSSNFYKEQIDLTNFLRAKYEINKM